MKEPRGQELINRYKKNYRIPENANISEEMILRHWELEKKLTLELLSSTPENRWEVFERCYSRLYQELYWLNKLTHTDVKSVENYSSYSLWMQLIGFPPKKIYEVGSGKGEMIAYLAKQGYQCRATEITRERGQKFIKEVQNLTWSIIDGVHLASFEQKEFYDVVFSNQVIEHLHPDDIITHFKNTYAILKKGGRYIFSTPHRYNGPCDISQVFKSDVPKGMHLKEYTFREIKNLLLKAGFLKIESFFKIPRTISNNLNIDIKPRTSTLYLWYLIFLETLMGVFPKQNFRRRIFRIAKIILFTSGINIIATK